VSIFWNVVPCSHIEVYQRFGGMCSFYGQSRRVRREGKWQVALFPSQKSTPRRQVASISVSFSEGYQFVLKKLISALSPYLGTNDQDQIFMLPIYTLQLLRSRLIFFSFFFSLSLSLSLPLYTLSLFVPLLSLYGSFILSFFISPIIS
jgi:hypothetical protein